MRFSGTRYMFKRTERADRLSQWMSLLVLCAVSAGTAALLMGCGSDSNSNNSLSNVLYVTTNDPAPGSNAVLGYRRAADGSLTPLPGSPYLMGGTGVSNPAQLDGPDDDDQNMIVSPDHRFLYTVNSGSNTIAVFRINSDGSLTAAPGSPFPSGGVEPVSVGLTGNRLYVVNKNQDPGQAQTANGANYTVFQVNADGSLTSIQGSTVAAPKDASSSQALISRNSQFLFDAEEGTAVLRAFKIGSNGLLTDAPGSPLAPPVVNGTQAAPLGLATHPTQNLLYVGFVNVARLGVYSIDPTTGALTLVTHVPNSGNEICWLITSRDGKRLYTDNMASNSISQYDLADPRNPVEAQHMVMKDAGSGGAFQLTLDPTEKLIYVVQQRTTLNAADTKGNAIHVLNVAANGSLTEAAFSPITLPVPSNAHPQGIVVF
jgi:6-phosphogluconolactonase (cycloisomerase 2 family)